jgi:hypothetical protein
MCTLQSILEAQLTATGQSQPTIADGRCASSGGRQQLLPLRAFHEASG